MIRVRPALSLIILGTTVLHMSATGGVRAQAPPPVIVDNSSFYQGVSDASSLAAVVNARLAAARTTLERLLSVTGTRTVENTLRPLDEIRGHVLAAAALSSIISQLHPDAALREAAEPLLRAASALGTEIGLHRGVFDALGRIEVIGLDPATSHYLRVTLDDYRRSGVDKDDATLVRIAALRNQITEVTQTFDRQIRDGVRRFEVDAADLAGLPADFIAARQPDAAGRVTLTTQAPDSQPVMSYARNEALRRRMLIETQNVAYPANIPVLQRMVALRHDLARELGYTTWADYDVEDRMAASTRAASEFIDRIVQVSTEAMTSDYRQLLERKRQDHPSATEVFAWETAYYSEQVRRAAYAFDSQTVRPYFPYNRVRDGMIALTERLFGLELTRVTTVSTWHPAVEVYDVTEGGRPVGRVYLDVHPRPGKAGSGASAATVRPGVDGRQLPEVVLIARFPGGDPGDPGLMTSAQVSTFLHEFGHVVHALSSGRQPWAGLTRVRERDFIEAPSQLLEEWASDPVTLATFARHHETNEPIPAALVRQMRRADQFGRGLRARQQMVLARLALSLHDRAPAQVDVIALHREFTRRYSPVPVVEDAHMPAAFSHLANTNYAAAYYTYLWSEVISRDLFTAFDGENLLDARPARRYRETILAAGGSKPADQLVRDFLGRPFNADAYERWLNESTTPSP